MYDPAVMPLRMAFLVAMVGACSRDTTRHSADDAASVPIRVVETDPTEQFWIWFVANSDALRAHVQRKGELLGELDRRLKRIHPDLTFELDPPGSESRRRFVIGDHGREEMAPVIEAVYLAAPAELNRWWYIDMFRGGAGLTEPAVVKGVRLHADDVRFVHRHVDERTDLVLYVEGLVEHRDDPVTGAAFELLINALAENVVMSRVGAIEWRPLRDAPANAQPLTELWPVFYERYYVLTRADCESLASHAATVDPKRSKGATLRRCVKERWDRSDNTCYRMSSHVAGLDRCDHHRRTLLDDKPRP